MQTQPMLTHGMAANARVLDTGGRGEVQRVVVLVLSGLSVAVLNFEFYWWDFGDQSPVSPLLL